MNIIIIKPTEIHENGSCMIDMIMRSGTARSVSLIDTNQKHASV